MSIETTVLQGNSLLKNPLPSSTDRLTVKLNGIYNGKKASFGLDEDILSKHMMLIGGTGCGKSTLFYHIVSQLRTKMTNDDVMIIFDTKGDYYSNFYKKGDFVLGNSVQYRDDSVKWNVFKELVADGWKDNDVLMNTQEVCRSIFSERTDPQKNGGSNLFFPNAARELLVAVLMIMFRMGSADERYRREFFYNEELLKLLNSFTVDDYMELLDDVDDFRSILSYIEGTGEQSQGVLSELYSVIRDIFIGVFAERGGFSIREFVRNKSGKVLFVEYDLSVGSVLTPIYKLIFDLALKEALGRQRSQGNVYLICDEFKLLPGLRHIDDAVNFGRSLGVKVFAGLQSISQLFETYGEMKGQHLIAGFSSVIAFRSNDETTRRYISELFGNNIILYIYKKIDGKYIERERTGRTVEDWDLNSLKVGEAVVGLPFSFPFKFYFEDY